MRHLLLAAAVALSPSFAGAQGYFPPPGPGTPVNFVACPTLTGNGYWTATDYDSGYTFSLVGAPPPPANLYIRVTGITSPVVAPYPGWLLSGLKIVPGRTPCRSIGVPQPWRPNILEVLSGAVAAPVAALPPVVPLPPPVTVISAPRY